MEPVDMETLDKVLVEEPRPARSRDDPFWQRMSIRFGGHRGRMNCTQLCLKLLLHAYDNKVAYSADTPLWRGEDGIYYKVKCKNVLTFKTALVALKEKHLISLYRDEAGHSYMAPTEHAMRLLMPKRDDQGKTLAALFASIP